MLNHMSSHVTSQSCLCQQLRGDKIWTELRAAGWLAGASWPRGHITVSRPSTETAVLPQQGEISSAYLMSYHSGIGVCLASLISLSFSCARHEEPLLTDPICWPCLHISQTGPPSCSASALFSASAKTTSTPFYFILRFCHALKFLTDTLLNFF